MRIQHNIMAMNAYTQYNKNTKALSGNLEKLASGYKINRAGDDAAGLAISEKMRAQITNLDAAQKNVKDGVSLVKTAEGAMQEIHDMLNKMSYLATQSANGTYQDEVDRENLQKEVDSLRTEINRIAQSANFNGIKLLDGPDTDGTTAAATSSTDTLSQFLTGTAAFTIAATGATQGTNTILHKDGKASKGTTFDIDLSNTSFAKSAASPAAQVITLTVGGVAITTSTTVGEGTMDAAAIAKKFDGKTAVIGGMTYDIKANGTKVSFSMQTANIDGITTAASYDGNYNATIGIAGNDYKAVGDTSYSTSNVSAGNGLTATELADTIATTAFATASFVDGQGIRIGNEAYVFALSQETLDKYKGMDGDGIKVVDLTDMSSKDATTGEYKLDTNKNANALRDATDRLTVAAKDNDMFVVEHEATDGKLAFRERVDYYDNNPDHVDLSDEEVVKAQFQTFTGVKTAEEIAAEKANLPETTIEDQVKEVKLQIGDSSDSFNQMEVKIKSMRTGQMGVMNADGKVIEGKTIDDVDIGTQEGAASAVEIIKGAINYVSSVRGDLGAIQNRLDHTGNNLAVMQENIQDAESTIRDTDVASEMMKYVKNNILVQSSQAMLAQANQVPQGVLQLLG